MNTTTTVSQDITKEQALEFYHREVEHLKDKLKQYASPQSIMIVVHRLREWREGIDEIADNRSPIT